MKKKFASKLFILLTLTAIIATSSFLTVNGVEIDKSISVSSSQQVSSESVTLGVGETYTLNNLKWNSSNTSVVTVSNSIITAKKVGTANLTADTSNGKTVTCKVTVKPAPTSVKVDTSSLTLGTGETFIIAENTNSGSYAKSFTWSSSNTSVATVKKTTANKAEITAKSNGTANITIKTYNGKTATCKVTVKSAPTNVKVDTSSLTLGTGETFIIAENTNSGSYAKSFTWSSSNTSVATVKKTTANKAEITAKSNGTANITIKTYNGKTATCKVTVKSAPTSVKVDTSSLTLGTGETFIIAENTNSSSYAKSFSWSSSNTSVATVKKTTANKAEITAKSNGTANITIKTYNGKTATCKVTVKSAPTSVTLSSSDLKMGIGKKYIISEITNSGSYAKSFTWSSSNTNVAIVKKTTANKAEIIAKGNGTATITIRTYNGKTATCKVNVSDEWHDAVYETIYHPAVTEKVWVVDQAAYIINKPIYIKNGYDICNQCGTAMKDSTALKEHFLANEDDCWSYFYTTVWVYYGTDEWLVKNEYEGNRVLCLSDDVNSKGEHYMEAIGRRGAKRAKQAANSLVSQMSFEDNYAYGHLYRVYCSTCQKYLTEDKFIVDSDSEIYEKNKALADEHNNQHKLNGEMEGAWAGEVDVFFEITKVPEKGHWETKVIKEAWTETKIVK